MPLTILTDADVNAVLFGLTRDDVLRLHTALAEALHSYSTATTSEESGCCSSNQPERISVKDANQNTTLFMPAVSDKAKGVKIVTIATKSPSETSATSPIDMSSLSLSDSASSRPGLSSSPSGANSPTTSRIAFAEPSSPRGSPSRSSKSIYRTSRGSLREAARAERESAAPSTSPKGSVTLLDANGQPRALVNASTLTGFRTALASVMLFKARESVHHVTCFGAGLQAFWHIYLSFLLRGPSIHHLTIINRSFDRARTLMQSLSRVLNPTVASYFASEHLHAEILTPSFGEYDRLLKVAIRASDVIYCTTPSHTPLWPHAHLTAPAAHTKGRYIAAIGSYTPEMREIPVEVLQQAVEPPSHSRHGGGHAGIHIHHRPAGGGGAVVVDTIEGAFKEAGELIASGIGSESVVELGELVMLVSKDGGLNQKREERHSRDRTRSGSRTRSRTRSKSGGASAGAGKEWPAGDRGMMQWLESGLLIFKGVGMGLMDVVVGMEIVRLAEERGVGTTVHDF